jgi:hypothetical protein
MSKDMKEIGIVGRKDTLFDSGITYMMVMEERNRLVCAAS